MYTPEELQTLKEKNQHDEALQFLRRFDRKQLAEMLADCRWEYREKEMQEASRRGEIRKLEQRLEAANEKIDELEDQNTLLEIEQTLLKFRLKTGESDD